MELPPIRPNKEKIPSTSTSTGEETGKLGEEGSPISRVPSQSEMQEVTGKKLAERTIETDLSSEIKEPQTAQDYFELGKNYFEKGDIEAAKKFFSGAIKFQPAAPQIIAEIAILYQNTDSPYVDLGDIKIVQLLLIDNEDPPKAIIGFDATTIVDTINQLPDNQKANAMARLTVMQEMAQAAKVMIEDAWTKAYTNDFIQARLNIRKNEILEKVADKLEIKGNAEEGILIDPKTGKLFNDLRGTNSVVDKLVEYIKSIGGDYALVQDYLDDQKGDSWNFLPQVFKFHIAKLRTLSEGAYYWRDTFKVAENKYNNYMLTGDKDKFEKTFCACHAFTTEMLNKMDLPGKDNKEQTIKIYRTESRVVLEEMECQKTSDEQFDNMMYRGALESGSITIPVIVYSPEVTVQKVPTHRIFWTYLTKNPAEYADPNKTCLYSNYEMEFNFIPEYIPFSWNFMSQSS